MVCGGYEDDADDGQELTYTGTAAIAIDSACYINPNGDLVDEDDLCFSTSFC